MVEVDLFGEGAEFEHVGMCLASVRDALPGAELVLDPIQKVRVAFFDLHGLRMEGIEPAGDDSPILNEMNRGVKLLHLCFRVPDIDAAARHARAFGLLPISKLAPAAAFEGRRIAWLYSRTMGLFELVEAAQPEVSATS